MKLGTWSDDCRTGGDRTKLSFWNTQFLEKYSVNLIFSTTCSLLCYSHPGYVSSIIIPQNKPDTVLVYPFKGHQDWNNLSKFKGSVKKSISCETLCSWNCWKSQIELKFNFGSGSRAKIITALMRNGEETDRVQWCVVVASTHYYLVDSAQVIRQLCFPAPMDKTV